MDGFFQQQEENRRLHKRIDELQTELREILQLQMIHQDGLLRMDNKEQMEVMENIII